MAKNRHRHKSKKMYKCVYNYEDEIYSCKIKYIAFANTAGKAKYEFYKEHLKHLYSFGEIMSDIKVKIEQQLTFS